MQRQQVGRVPGACRRDLHPCLRCGLRHGFGQAGDALQAVHRQRQAPALGLQARGQACHTQQLGVGDHLVGQGDVAHATGGQLLQQNLVCVLEGE